MKTLSVPLLLALASTALAQDAAAPSAPSQGDTRWAVYTACSAVFACIVLYLVASHLRNAKVKSDLDHLESRLDRMESNS